MAKRERRIRAMVVEEDDGGFPMGIYGIQEREAGTGSVGETTIGGRRYQRGRVWIEDAKGVRQRKSVYGKSIAEVERKINALKKTPSVRQGLKTLTVAQFLEDRFLPGIKPKIRLNTYKTYRRAVLKHIVPRIGKAKFGNLTPANVDAWVSELSGDDRVGQRAAQQAFMVLKRAYNYAIALDLIDRSPVASMRAPKVKRSDQYILSLEEANRLIEAASQTEWFALIHLAIATSMRQGELFGLRWRDLDLKRGFLRVANSLGMGEKGEPMLVEPKTASSRRRVDLPADSINALKAHRESQKGRPNPHDIVFPSDRGEFVRKDNFRKRDWLPLLESANLPHVTFHSLRHVGNSILAQEGVPLKVLQHRLGHATSRVTFDVYTHLMPSDTAVAAETMGKLLTTSGLKSGLTHNGASKKKTAKKTKKPR